MFDEQPASSDENSGYTLRNADAGTGRGTAWPSRKRDADGCLKSINSIMATAQALKRASRDLYYTCKELIASAELMRHDEETIALLFRAKEGTATTKEVAQLQAARQRLEGHVLDMQLSQEETASAVGKVMAASDALQQRTSHWHLPGMVKAVTHSWHNSTGSRFLALPDAALHLISRCVGQRSRLVCRQMCDAYGCPGTRVAWLPYTCDTWPEAITRLPLSEVLVPWQWAPHVTRLTLSSRDPLPASDFTTIAAHLPNLCELTCPWLEHCDAAQRPPTLTALTALRLEPLKRSTEFAAAACMEAFAQLPALMPQLQNLALEFHEHSPPNASFATAMQQLGGRLTSLHLDIFTWEWSPWGPEPLQHLCGGVAALAPSLRRLRVLEPQAFGPGFPAAVAALSRLTFLKASSSAAFDGGGHLACLPPCHQLRSVRHLDLQGLESHEQEGVYPEDVAGVAAWLTAGQASIALEELLLPTIRVEAEVGDPGPLLEACAGYRNLTSLEVTGVRNMCLDDAEADNEEVVPTGWPAEVARLTGLKRLRVVLDVEELNSTAEWSVLTALTELQLQRAWVGANQDVAETVSQEALQQGLGQMAGLQRVKLDAWCHDREDAAGVALLRQRLLRALSDLPSLEVLDLSRLVRAEDPGAVAEELAVFAAGRARSSLKSLLLDDCLHGVVEAVRRVLLWVTVDLQPEGVWCSPPAAEDG